MRKIIVDAMGGDNAPGAVVNGCVDAVKNEKDFIIHLVGNEKKINKILKECDYTGNRIKVHNADDVITNNDEPAKAVKHKKDSSMVVAFNLLKDIQGDALVSCGSTGALLACSVMILKRIKGINRPALGTVIPTKTGTNGTLLLDVGLNAECKPINLVQFGILGKCYMKCLYDIKNPKVGLINIGVEPEKGNDLAKEAYDLLKTSGLMFMGNVEGNEITSGNADVLVCDGFTGNVVLKTIEGVAGFFIGELKEIFFKSLKSKISALLIKDGVKKLKSKVDTEEIGGAPILGVDGLVIKSHGNSTAKTVENVIIKSFNLAQNDFINNIKKELDQRR